MIVLDVETSGTVPWKHSLLSIGAVDFSNPENRFYAECGIREGAEIDPNSLKVNGFSMDEIKSGSRKPQKGTLIEFTGWARGIGDRTLAGHNLHMDVYFIEFALEHYGIESPFPKRIVDIHAITYAHMSSRGISPPMERNGSGISSRVVQMYCGLPEEPRPHNALNGALIEAEELSRLLHGSKLAREYGTYPVPAYLSAVRYSSTA